MHAYVMKIVVIDFENAAGSQGLAGLTAMVESNRHVSINVAETSAVDLGMWEDSHPLNQKDTDRAAWLAEHGVPCDVNEAHEEWRVRMAARVEVRRLKAARLEAAKDAARQKLTSDQLEALGITQ
jgi:hypothetical protein